LVIGLPVESIKKWKGGQRNSVYRGEFHSDKKHGFGKMIWSTGARYDG